MIFPPYALRRGPAGAWSNPLKGRAEGQRPNGVTPTGAKHEQVKARGCLDERVQRFPFRTCS